VPADHAVSVATYVACSFVGGLLVKLAYDRISPEFMDGLRLSLVAAGERLPEWQAQVEGCAWPLSDLPPYFLGRGVSASSAWEAQMIWEEAAKSPASAMTTGEFRHGPQEIFHAAGVPVALFLHASAQRDTDIAILHQMNDLKAEVLVVGQDLPAGLPGIGFVLPNIDADFQCAIEGIPVQLLAERLARRKGVDCDAFRYGSFIVESEEGLTPAAGV
jgi:glucosamine--fructose-6-phosphate aminotransferase (isomerizing)